MPVLDPHIINDLTGRLVAEVHTHMLTKRSVDHSVLETLAVGEYYSFRPLEDASITYVPFLLC